MKKTIKTISMLAIIAVAIAFISSCKKSTTADTTKPTIAVVEPTDMDTLSITLEPELHIEFTASDNRALKSLNVIVTDSSLNTLASYSPTVSNMTLYPFHEHMMLSSAYENSKIFVKITAIDEALNTTEQKFTLFVNP